MDYVQPKDIILNVIEAGKGKIQSSFSHLVMKGALAGVFLGYATTLAFTAEMQSKIPFLGAILFPIGFVLIILLGLELVTGNFAVLPCSYVDKQVKFKEMIKNFSYVFIGNLLGSLFYACLYFFVVTNAGHVSDGDIIRKIISVSEAKTITYKEMGTMGIGLALTKAILCNWMVTLGAFMAFASKSTTGKIAAMWLPILTFFAQGFEHAIVNMFVIPAGMLLGANVSISDWWLYNQIPVTIGNFIGGCFLTGFSFYFLYRKREDKHELKQI